MSPGVLGLAFGFVAPFALPGWLATVTTLGVSYAGYKAPRGSWMRNFSIGAGIGGMAYMGLRYGSELRDAAIFIKKAGYAVTHPWEATKAFGVVGLEQVATWAGQAYDGMTGLSWLKYGIMLK
jgi:hypothetical protein